MTSRSLSWTGALSTDFATAGNWFDVTDSETALTPPVGGDTVTFDRAADGVISGSGSVATIFISNAGAWVLTDATLSDTAGLLFLGHSVASSLTITAASTLSSTATFDSIGHDSGATNLLAVSAPARCSRRREALPSAIRAAAD